MSNVVNLQNYRATKVFPAHWDFDEHDLAVAAEQIGRGERVLIGADFVMVEALIEAVRFPVEAWWTQDGWVMARTDLVREGVGLI